MAVSSTLISAQLLRHQQQSILSHFQNVYLLHSRLTELHVAVSMQYFASLTTPFYSKRRGSEIRTAVKPHVRPALRRILPSLD